MSNPNIRLPSFRDVCLIVAFAVALVACKPATQVPLSGRVTVQYSGTSKSDVLFDLENGLSLSIRFKGWPATTADSTPMYTGGCRDAESSDSAVTVIVGPIAREYSSPKSIEVLSGKHMRLAVPSYDFQKFSGGRCSITLTLDDGTMIDSGEFKP